MITPAFIFDEASLRKNTALLQSLVGPTGAQIYFPVKCHNLCASLEIIAEDVQGFAASSLFEARLAREVSFGRQQIHFTSPSLRDDEIGPLLALCDGIAFNSLSQWARHKNAATGRVTCGLRVNPQLSLVKDARYDPCQPHSRLGVPLDRLKQVLLSEPDLVDGIEGIHFHTNCDATNWSPLLELVQVLDCEIPNLLRRCRWLNLGGGYLLDSNTGIDDFGKAVRLLRSKYDLGVIFEPGAGVVRDACVLVAQVVDIVLSDGVQVAVLDTTVNHMPEVFEYQFSPDVAGHTAEGPHCYVLAGATCLPGDVFGEYAFHAPLHVGSTVTFTGVGAYTLVKAHMFNGVNLPTVYGVTATGELRLQKQYNYDDFRNRLGHTTHHESV